MTTTMYPPIVNSPQTTLAAGIDDTQTTITITAGTALPDAPNLAVIGDGNEAETILYSTKVGTTLSNVTRGFQGAARAWNSGTNIARYFTAADHQAMIDNIEGTITPAYSEVTFNSRVNKTEFEGYAKRVEVRGRTIHNALVNGNFSDGTTNVYTIIGVNTVTDNILSNTGNGANANNQFYMFGNDLKLSDEGYYKARYRVTNDVCLSCEFGVYTNDGLTLLKREIISTPNNNEWNYISIKFENTIVDSGGKVKIYFIHRYADSTTANEKVMQVDGNYGVFAISITSDIATKTEDELDAMTPYPFEGTEHVQPMVVNVYGMNLFDKNSINVGGYFSAEGNIVANENSEYSTQYIPVNSTSAYAWNGDSDNKRIIILTYDIKQNFIERLLSYSGSLFDTYSFNEDVAFVKIANYNNLNTSSLQDFQFQEGDTATDYEPHISAAPITLPYAAGRLPNGVYDYYLKDENGMWWFVQRMKPRVLGAGDITGLITTGTYVDIVTIPLSIFEGATGLTNYNPASTYYEGKEKVSASAYDDASKIGKYGMGVVNMIDIVEKGTYIDISAAKADLTGKIVYYQLATPVITEITNPSLITWLNGQLSLEMTSGLVPEIVIEKCDNAAAVREQLLIATNANAKWLQANTADIATNTASIVTNAAAIAANAKKINNELSYSLMLM